MNQTKWIQLFSSFILILLPAAIHFRNLKHADRRTKIHGRMTMCLLGLWLFSAFGVSWATYRTFSRKDLAPAFALYLNEMKLEQGALVSLPTTNGQQLITFTAENVGDWMADNARLHFVTATNMNVAIPDDRGEWRQGIWEVPTNQVNLKSASKYFYTEPWDIARRSKCQFPSLLLTYEHIKSDEAVIALMLLRCTSRNASTYDVWFLLQSHPAIKERQIQYEYWRQAPNGFRETFQELKNLPSP